MTGIKTKVGSLALAIGLFGFAGVGSAADLPAAPYYKAPPPVADEWNPWMIRLRALGVIPNDSGSVDQVPGSGVKVTNNLTPELDISYFFTRNIAAELILGVTRHDITGTGVAATNGLPVGSSWLLPPTLTLQYHFTDLGAFKPYIGAGVNYTVFFDQSAGNAANAAGTVVTSSHLHNAFAPVVQVGFDVMINKHVGWNVDLKKLWLEPNWNGTLNGAVPVTGKVNLDPWLVGTGLTYKF
ncbi:MAG TPA: OmpW family protein [Bradyrhizobium sp.]|uniref:OmpW/AlkL family protein n=1 Tax=Bradyrhizobium sp. TaxID=376 RepID=UPI002D7FDF99|nr:OmpW family protein [Bradyrhizobium sp.]HET7888302.1 OmpW family protein [Bradyrhizobium sp.]